MSASTPLWYCEVDTYRGSTLGAGQSLTQTLITVNVDIIGDEATM
jgi:hypothetical protein